MSHGTLLQSLFVRYVAWRESGGERLDPESLCREAPELAEALRTQIDEYERLLAAGGVRRLGAVWPRSTDGIELTPRSPAGGERSGPAGEGARASTDSESQDSDSQGEVVGRRYRLLRRLGEGGLGQVWLAEDLKLGVELALKALHPEHAAERRYLDLMRREVRLARSVLSPHVCRIYDLIEVGGEELVSMEYVDGETLTELLNRQSPLSLSEATDIGLQLLTGLQAIHDAGLVHRDLKPDNVMVTRTGRVVVMDLGLARPLSPEASHTVAGTPAYMAPEQAVGLAVDARADVYAAGMVLAEMVAPGGARNRESRQSIWEGVRSDPPLLGETPWKAMLEKAVARDPARRWESASALARALEGTTQGVDGEELRPYPGLSAFTEEQAEYFYGREVEAERLWSKLSGSPPKIFGLLGPAGVGKSSFLRAGLLPSRPQGWSVLLATPSRQPFQELARALASEPDADAEAADLMPRVDDPALALELARRWRGGAAHALLVLDPFEELFTEVEPDEAERFADLLHRLALDADVHVLLSLRDDFLFPCQGLASLGSVFTDLTPLAPLKGAALRRALVEPARKCAYTFEDAALASEMLAEVEGKPEALPLLAFAVARLWDRRDRQRGLLTRAAFDDIGGVAGAMERHAERTLDAIGPARQPIVRALFRHLVTTQGTRAARERSELLSLFRHDDRHGSTPAGRDAAAEVLTALIDSGLLNAYEIEGRARDAPQQRIEVAHESLLRSWPRLKRWRTQDVEAAQLYDEIRRAARLWEEHDRSPESLWTGTAYRELAEWQKRNPGRLSGTEEAFAEAASKLTQRLRLRRRLAAASALSILVIALGALGLGAGSRLRALLRPDLPPTPVSRLSITLPKDAWPSFPNPFLAIAVSPDGSRVAYTGVKPEGGPPGSWHRLYVRELDGTEARPVKESYDAHNPFFSPDGRWIGFFQNFALKKVAVSGGAPLTLFEAETVGSSTEGTWGQDGTIVFQNSGSGLYRVPAEGGEAETLTVLDEARDELAHSYPRHATKGHSIFFTVIRQDRTSRVENLDLETGERTVILEDARDAVPTRSGHLLFVRDNIVMAVPVGEDRLEVTGPAVPVQDPIALDRTLSVAQFGISDNGSLVYLKDDPKSRERRILRVDRQGRYEELTGIFPRDYMTLDLSPDGRLLALGAKDRGGDRSLYIYDIERRVPNQISLIEGDYARFSADSKKIAFSSPPSWAAVYQQPVKGSGEPELLFRSQEGGAWPLSWSPDGQHLLLGVAPSWIELWALKMGASRQSAPFVQGSGHIWTAAFSPDGRWVAYCIWAKGDIFRIYLKSFPDGASQIPVANGCSPVWSPDGKELFYWNKGMQRVTVSTDPVPRVGVPTTLFRRTGTQGPAEYAKLAAVPIYSLGGNWGNAYAISPNGEHFYVVGKPEEPERQLQEIVVVQNYFEELRHLAPPS